MFESSQHASPAGASPPGAWEETSQNVHLIQKCPPSRRRSAPARSACADPGAPLPEGCVKKAGRRKSLQLPCSVPRQCSASRSGSMKYLTEKWKETPLLSARRVCQSS